MDVRFTIRGELFHWYDVAPQKTVVVFLFCYVAELIWFCAPEHIRSRGVKALSIIWLLITRFVTRLYISWVVSFWVNLVVPGRFRLPPCQLIVLQGLVNRTRHRRVLFEDTTAYPRDWSLVRPRTIRPYLVMFLRITRSSGTCISYRRGCRWASHVCVPRILGHFSFAVVYVREKTTKGRGLRGSEGGEGGYDASMRREPEVIAFVSRAKRVDSKLRKGYSLYYNKKCKKLRVHLSTLSTGEPFPPKPHQQP